MSTTTIERLTSAPIDHKNKIALWLADAIFTENLDPAKRQFKLSDTTLDRIAAALPMSCAPIFWKSLSRKRKAAAEHFAWLEEMEERDKKQIFGKAILRRRRFRALIRSKAVSLIDTLHSMIDDVDAEAWLVDSRALAHHVKGLERYFFRTKVIETKGRFEGKEYHDRLPLYACSGELEAASLHYHRNRQERLYWHVGRDGGGQPEIRFRIHPTTTAKACKLVSRIGSQSRNGGHIHLNCRKNDEIGNRVFHGLRANLVWMRYLANHARRSGRWSSVDNTPNTFAEAKRIKGCAISCNTWNHTGTVEMRLWGTTAKPETWAFRSRLMQSIARMTETESQPMLQMLRENAAPTFLTFARWAAQHDPQTLRETLHEMRRKSRTNADRIGADQCRALVAAFDASEIRLTGYRRRSTITPQA
jgi:hypothetical protein